MLHEGEMSLFSRDAWGRIIQLTTLGMLSNSDIERIIEKAIVRGIYQMGVSQLDSILASVMAEGWESGSSDFRTGLTGSDTVH
jgi:hypothetical protein